MRTLLFASLCLGLAVAQSTAPSPLTHEQRGDIYVARKMYREAIEEYGLQKPASAVVWNKTGIAWHQLGELGAARKSYERAIKLDRKYADAFNNVGTIFYAQKKYSTAIARYRKALALSPDSAPYWSNLGTAWYARGNYKEMSKAYARALEIDPNVFETHGSVGTRMLDQSVEDRARFHYELARMYAIAGKNDLAIQYLRKALEEGFRQKEKLQGKEFSALRETREFKDLMAQEPRVL